MEINSLNIIQFRIINQHQLIESIKIIRYKCMSSMKWVDMCGSGSEIEGSSDDQPAKNEQPAKEIVSPTDLKKTISSPEPSSKSINVYKLSIHKENKVWLYALADNLKNRQKQGDQILEQNKQFQEVKPNSRGWEVKLDTQLAKKYLQSGYSQRGIYFKFLYSIKNQNRQATGKLEKKYSEKYPDQRYQRNQKPKPKYEKNGYARDREDDRGEKKRVKYVAKETTGKKQEQQKPKLEQIIQEGKKIQQKKELQDLSEGQKKVDPELKEKNKQQLQSNQEVKQLGNKEKYKQKSRDQEQDNKAKEKQKDKKKKKFKGKGGNGNFHDPNNPFSSLA